MEQNSDIRPTLRQALVDLGTSEEDADGLIDWVERRGRFAKMKREAEEILDRKP